MKDTMEEISLIEIFQTLKKRIWLIISITSVAAIISAIVSFFVLTPIYQSSTQILVNQATNQQAALYNVNDIRTNIELINTYNVIIKSPAILNKVIEELDIDRSFGELNSQITVGSENESQVVKITVQDSDPKMAANIANTTATVFQREIVKIMNVNNVSILAEAENSINPSPIKPQPVLNIAIAVVVGLMVGVGIAFLLEYLDNTIKTEQDITKMLDIPILGTVTVIHIESDMKERKQSVLGAKIGSEKVES